MNNEKERLQCRSFWIKVTFPLIIFLNIHGVWEHGESFFVSGFSAPSRKTERTFFQRQEIFTSSSALRVTLIPNNNVNEGDLEEADDRDVSQIKPLFDTSLIDPSKSEQIIDDLYDDDDEDEDYGEPQFYDIDYEDDEDYSELPAVDDLNDQSTYSRDEDAILTEREDRFYVDDKGFRRKVETCILIGVEVVSELRKDRRRNDKMSPNTYDENDWEQYFLLDESLREMRELVKTAGMDIVSEVTQRLNDPNPKTYIGSGKLKETKELLEKLDCCTVVFDAELTPGQQKHLENALNKEVIQNDFLGSEMVSVYIHLKRNVSKLFHFLL